MANNMRKMFTEKQISDIAKSSVSGGTKLYRHIITDVDGSYYLELILTTPNKLNTENISVEQFINVVINNLVAFISGLDQDDDSLFYLQFSKIDSTRFRILAYNNTDSTIELKTMSGTWFEIGSWEVTPL